MNSCAEEQQPDSTGSSQTASRLANWLLARLQRWLLESRLLRQPPEVLRIRGDSIKARQLQLDGPYLSRKLPSAVKIESAEIGCGTWRFPWTASLKDIRCSLKVTVAAPARDGSRPRKHPCVWCSHCSKCCIIHLPDGSSCTAAPGDAHEAENTRPSGVWWSSITSKIIDRIKGQFRVHLSNVKIRMSIDIAEPADEHTVICPTCRTVHESKVDSYNSPQHVGDFCILVKRVDVNAHHVEFRSLVVEDSISGRQLISIADASNAATTDIPLDYSAAVGAVDFNKKKGLRVVLPGLVTDFTMDLLAKAAAVANVLICTEEKEAATPSPPLELLVPQAAILLRNSLASADILRVDLQNLEYYSSYFIKIGDLELSAATRSGEIEDDEEVEWCSCCSSDVADALDVPLEVARSLSCGDLDTRQCVSHVPSRRAHSLPSHSSSSGEEDDEDEEKEEEENDEGERQVAFRNEEQDSREISGNAIQTTRWFPVPLTRDTKKSRQWEKVNICTIRSKIFVFGDNRICFGDIIVNLNEERLEKLLNLSFPTFPTLGQTSGTVESPVTSSCEVQVRTLRLAVLETDPGGSSAPPFVIDFQQLFCSLHMNAKDAKVAVFMKSFSMDADDTRILGVHNFSIEADSSTAPTRAPSRATHFVLKAQSVNMVGALERVQRAIRRSSTCLGMLSSLLLEPAEETLLGEVSCSAQIATYTLDFEGIAVFFEKCQIDMGKESVSCCCAPVDFFVRGATWLFTSREDALVSFISRPERMQLRIRGLFFRLVGAVPKELLSCFNAIQNFCDFFKPTVSEALVLRSQSQTLFSMNESDCGSKVPSFLFVERTVIRVGDVSLEIDQLNTALHGQMVSVEHSPELKLIYECFKKSTYSELNSILALSGLRFQSQEGFAKVNLSVEDLVVKVSPLSVAALENVRECILEILSALPSSPATSSQRFAQIRSHTIGCNFGLLSIELSALSRAALAPCCKTRWTRPAAALKARDLSLEHSHDVSAATITRAKAAELVIVDFVGTSVFSHCLRISPPAPNRPAAVCEIREVFQDQVLEEEEEREWHLLPLLSSSNGQSRHHNSRWTVAVALALGPLRITLDQRFLDEVKRVVGVLIKSVDRAASLTSGARAVDSPCSGGDGTNFLLSKFAIKSISMTIDYRPLFWTRAKNTEDTFAVILSTIAMGLLGGTRALPLLLPSATVQQIPLSSTKNLPFFPQRLLAVFELIFSDVLPILCNGPWSRVLSPSALAKVALLHAKRTRHVRRIPGAIRSPTLHRLRRAVRGTASDFVGIARAAISGTQSALIFADAAISHAAVSAGGGNRSAAVAAAAAMASETEEFVSVTVDEEDAAEVAKFVGRRRRRTSTSSSSAEWPGPDNNWGVLAMPRLSRQQNRRRRRKSLKRTIATVEAVKISLDKLREILHSSDDEEAIRKPRYEIKEFVSVDAEKTGERQQLLDSSNNDDEDDDNDDDEDEWSGRGTGASIIFLIFCASSCSVICI